MTQGRWGGQQGKTLAERIETLISGFNKPSKRNEAAFYAAVDGIARISGRLLCSLESTAAPKNRQEEVAKAQTRAA